jgi:hypothetical protein
VIAPVLLLVTMLAGQLVLPLYFAYVLWHAREETRWVWCIKLASSTAFLIFVMLVGRWDILSYYLRFVVIGLFAAAAIAGGLRARRLPWRRAGRVGTSRTLIAEGLVLVAFVGAAAFVASGLVYAGEPVHLTFPLRDGAYFVGQGGNNSLINYHNTNSAQRFALDILKLNAFGARASALYSADHDRYEIFGAAVYSPCSGTVAEAVDGLVDHVPPATDTSRPAGNHVVIGCANARVLLAHLQKGSVQAASGAEVSAGDVIGRVGNSGNTTEPHLHIHAVGADADVTTGEGLPIVFDGQFPVRNTVVRR